MFEITVLIFVGACLFLLGIETGEKIARDEQDFFFKNCALESIRHKNAVSCHTKMFDPNADNDLRSSL